MSATEPSWDLYGAFLAVMRTGSLSAASRQLGVAQPTVRRQIERLEELLDVVLFTRSPNGLVPTEVALSTLPYAESIAASSRALVRSVSGGLGSNEGTVRMTTSEIVGVEVMPPILARLAMEHPRIRVELAITNRTEDLLRLDAEIAVRMTRPTQEGLLMKRIGEIEIGLFAAPEYLVRCPAPSKSAQLLEHTLIGSDRERGLATALEFWGVATKPRDFILRTDSDVAQLAAVRAGIGIGACQVPLAKRTNLIRVLPKLSVSLEAWVVVHEDLRTSRRVRSVFDHVVSHLERYVQSGSRKRTE